MANYSKQTWIDDNPAYPLSAARMGVMEDGIYDAHYRPTVRAFNSANIAVGSASWTSLTFDSEAFDNATMHSTSSNTSRLTSTVSGIYLVGATVHFAANATGTRQLRLYQNGATVVARNATSSTLSGSVVTVLEITALVNLPSGNYVEVQAYQDSGGSLNVAFESGASPVFWATLVSAA